MNFEAIRSLLLAVELGSFTAAGEQMGVPPSTLSRRVNDLESDLGRKLLVRTGRGVRAADEARGTMTRLREVLLAVEACYLPPPTLTRLRVTAPVEMSISLLPPLLPAYRAIFPDVFVEIRGENRALGLVEEDFDLAIRAGPLIDSSYLARSLPSDRFVVVAAPPEAARIRTVKELADAEIVEVAGPSPELVGRWKGEAMRIRPTSVARVDSFTAALPMVLAGRAYSAMPHHVVREHLAEGILEEITAVQLQEVSLHALYPRRHREQPALSSFIDAVAQELTRHSS